LTLKKAFDTVDHAILLSKLHKLNLPSFLLHWLNSYLHDRRFRVTVRGSLSSWSSSPSGVPQGSVLGPTLFNIFINDLPSYLSYSCCLLFADDLKIYRSIQSATDHLLLQSDLDIIAQWAKDNRMNFNVDKSAVLHIGSSNLHQTYVLNGLPISSKDTVKDLGILIDNKLKFHKQCASAAKKAIATANYIFKSFNFLNSFLFSTLYKVFVRPHLEYAIQVWRPHYQKSHDILEKTQRKITKWCPGLRHLPYETRLQVLKLPTLTNRFNRGDMIETLSLSVTITTFLLTISLLFPTFSGLEDIGSNLRFKNFTLIPESFSFLTGWFHFGMAFLTTLFPQHLLPNGKCVIMNYTQISNTFPFSSLSSSGT
jgi:hypothetical protein